MRSAQDILGAKGRKVQPIKVEAWNKEMYLGSWPLKIKTLFHDTLKELETATSNDLSFVARVVVWSLCDKDGNPLLTEEHVPELLDMDGHALQQIFQAAVKLNHLDTGQINEAKNG
jgi:hypothetical protein